ncbi:MAG: tetratricopeptide repeat protein [Pyrinomonadaceae bacterium]
MDSNFRQLQTSTDFGVLLEDLEACEFSRDTVRMKELFAPFWADVEVNPEFEEIPLEFRGEMYRLAAWLYTTLGNEDGKSVRQESARELCTKAIECLERLDNKTDEIAMVRSLVAASYYMEGKIDEALIIMDDAAQIYKNDRLNHTNILIQSSKIFMLAWRRDFNESWNLVQEYSIPIELYTDPNVLYRFHSAAGILCSRIGKYEESEQHYVVAIENSARLNNWRGVANTYNNIAMCNMRAGEYERGLRNVNEALEIYRTNNEKAWVATALDTKALILMQMGNYAEGLEIINEAIELLESGTYRHALIDAFWAKTLLLLYMDARTEAIHQFVDLCDFAKRELGDFAADKFIEELGEVIFVKRENNLFGEVESFKRELITDSLKKSNGDISKAAERLSTNRQTLTKVMSNEFPEIFLNFGMSPMAMADSFI